VLSLAAVGVASAQVYGPNPAPTGVFVPLADGPVLAGTTGTPVNANGTPNTSTNSTTTTNVNGSTGSFTVGNGLQFSLNGSQLTFTINQNTNPGLFSLIDAFGQLNFSFTSMLGTEINIFSTIANSVATVQIAFGNQFVGNTNQNNANTTNNGSLPNANPVDDPAGGIDMSPGNPLGGT
jgi:hypothetical protein